MGLTTPPHKNLLQNQTGVAFDMLPGDAQANGNGHIYAK
jgi:hypothetical protein